MRKAIGRATARSLLTLWATLCAVGAAAEESAMCNLFPDAYPLVWMSYIEETNVLEWDKKVIVNPGVRRERKNAADVFTFFHEGKRVIEITRPLAETKDQVGVWDGGKSPRCSVGLTMRAPFEGKRDFCWSVHAIETFQHALKSADNHLSTLGPSTPWRQDFERKAAFALIYRPDLAKPSREQALKIIRAVHEGTRTIELPGYVSLRHFSESYEPEIRATIEESSATYRNRIAVPLAAAAMKKEMERLHYLAGQRKRVVLLPWAALGEPFVNSWLVVGAKKTPTGYSLHVVESGPEGMAKIVGYSEGSTTLVHEGQAIVPIVRSEDVQSGETALRLATESCDVRH